jgi:molybdate transport system regulatory protein
MKPEMRVYLMDDENRKFFGEGPYRLLRAVEETGSLRAAAGTMDMAYTKALKMLRHAEQAVGAPLTTRSTGGKDGGGSRLTPEGKELLAKYEAYRDQCAEANRRIYRQIFSTER